MLVLFPFIERPLLTKGLPAIRPEDGSIGEGLTMYAAKAERVSI